MTSLVRPLTYLVGGHAAKFLGSEPQAAFIGMIHDAAQSYSLVVDGVQGFCFNQIRRYATDSLAIYELRAGEKDLFRDDPEWIPIIAEP